MYFLTRLMSVFISICPLGKLNLMILPSFTNRYSVVLPQLLLFCSCTYRRLNVVACPVSRRRYGNLILSVIWFLSRVLSACFLLFRYCVICLYLLPRHTDYVNYSRTERYTHGIVRVLLQYKYFRCSAHCIHWRSDMDGRVSNQKSTKPRFHNYTDVYL